MTPAPVCILYTQDAELVRRTRAFLRTMSQVRHVSDPDRLESVLLQTGPSVLMMDLRSKECRELIDQIQNEQPDVLIIALGVGQSEALADAAGVSRVGLFSRTRKGDPYQLRAGLHCLPETEDLQFGERDALVRWFELHAHLISRANLLRTQDHRQRTIMRRALDMFGAEAIVPLYARGSIIGWVFFGHRVTGRLFDDRDLEGLTTLAEHVSTILENAFLYEEATIQKTLAETLLKSIPPGIVATDEDATVRWFNPPAEKTNEQSRPRRWRRCRAELISGAF